MNIFLKYEDYSCYYPFSESQTFPIPFSNQID
uniref:Uncharacterized protein n=1 Tax=Rhizophora mucronata TaxID=61149 RepID=A0A2P2JMP1_RHIMU